MFTVVSFHQAGEWGGYRLHPIFFKKNIKNLQLQNKPLFLYHKLKITTMNTIQIIKLSNGRMLVAKVKGIEYEGFSAYQYDTTDGTFINICATKRNDVWDTSRYGECFPEKFGVLGNEHGQYAFGSEAGAEKKITQINEKEAEEKNRIHEAAKQIPYIIEKIEKIRKKLIGWGDVKLLRRELASLSLPVSEEYVDELWRKAHEGYNHLNLYEDLYGSTVSVCDTFLEFLKKAA